LSPDATADVPPGVVTLASTDPATCAGDFTVNEVDETTFRDVPAVLPKVTFVAPVNPDPFTVTDVPPPSGPAAGDSDETLGAAAYVYLSVDTVADVPPAVLILTATVPATCAGAFTVNVVDEATFNEVPVVLPKVTFVAPVNPDPFTVTDVPPPSGPAAGDSDDTFGADAANAPTVGETATAATSAMNMKLMAILRP
jgi:hypothetical protein